MSDSRPVIAASEVGQYAFCARGWWLSRVHGHPSAHWQEMTDGESAHEAHGRMVVHYQRLQRLAQLLLIVAVVVGAVGVYLLARGA